MADLPSGFINIDTIINDKSVYAAEALVSYAKLLSGSRLSGKNSGLYIKILSANRKDAADSLFGGRNPFQMFSSVTAGKNDIRGVLDILVRYSPSELYIKIVYACFGLLLTVYSNPQYGMDIYMLTVNDLQHIAKFFSVDDDKLKDIILDLFYKLETLPPHYPAAGFAAKAVSVFNDASKKLDSIVPSSLL